MSDAERFNVLQALDLRHDELLQSLAELDVRIEAVIGQLRPQAGSVSDAAKPTSGRPPRLAA